MRASFGVDEGFCDVDKCAIFFSPVAKKFGIFIVLKICGYGKGDDCGQGIQEMDR